MSKCPECGKEITHLDNVQEVTKIWIFTVEKGGEAPVPHYEERERNSVFAIDGGIWYCPECETELFNNETDAVEFLKGEIEAKK